MKSLSLLILLGLFARATEAQAVRFFRNPDPAVNGGPGIGSFQAVPEPFNPALWPDGTLELFVDLCFGPTLYAYATGIPQGYLQGTQTQETMYFIADFADASTPGVTISMGQFYLPGTANMITWNMGQAVYIGPVGCGTGAGSMGALNYGAFLDLTSAIPGTFQNLPFSIQAVMLDSALGRFFTSQAVNFQM